MRPFYYVLAALALLMNSTFAGPLIESKEEKNLITGRASMLGRFEPIVNSVVVPFLVATGVVSLVRMVPGVVSSLPGMFGFAKRTGFESGEQYPKEFYDIMTILDNAAVKYGQHGTESAAATGSIQRQPVASASQQYQYQQYLQQMAQVQAAQQQAAQVAQAQAQTGQKTHATARQHQG